MRDTTTYAAEVLDREQRLRQLSRDLPQEPRGGAETASLPTGMHVESPGGGDLTTPHHDGSAGTAQPPRIVGNYAVISVLGHGGMGWVFKAQHQKLNRAVALKMLIGTPATDTRIAQRFAVEAQALARLEHPNIVPVYEAGDWEGVPYFAMKYISGGTLAENAARLRADPRAAVAVVAKIARAVGYLHAQGVSHRDLKPANILISDGDEPLVADFGLAKLHDADSSLTVTGVLLGTRYYMSPEQARGGREELTPACDIWALGVILHELIAGKLPFEAESHESLFKKICNDDPPPLVTAAGVAEPELGNVVRGCLAKSPGDRYATAQAVAEDLERWLAGEPVQAPAARGRIVWNRAGILGMAGVVLAGILWAIFGRDGQHGIARIEGPKTVLIGKAGEPAFYEPLPETVVKAGWGPEQPFTVESDQVGIVRLGAHAHPNGTIVEAEVQQMATNDITSAAGIFFRGKFLAGPTGRRLNCVIAVIDSIESLKTPPMSPPRSGYGELRAGRWDPASPSPWNLGPLGARHAIGRDRPGNGAASATYRLRVELSDAGPATVTLNGAPIGPIRAQEIDIAYDKASARDAGPLVPPGQRWGSEIGLIVQGCKAEFRNVTVQPVP